MEPNDRTSTDAPDAQKFTDGDPNTVADHFDAAARLRGELDDETITTRELDQHLLGAHSLAQLKRETGHHLVSYQPENQEDTTVIRARDDYRARIEIDSEEVWNLGDCR